MARDEHKVFDSDTHVVMAADNQDTAIGHAGGGKRPLESILLDCRTSLSIFLVGMMVLGTGVVSGQDYPNKPIRLVSSSIGGSVDLSARIIAPLISVPLGQPVIVDNRPSGVTPGVTVAKAPPNGYTLLIAGGVFVTGQLMEKTPYDPVKDFSPVTLTTSAPKVLVVTSSMPVKSVKELIALGKAKPGGLNYSAVGKGSSQHLAVELFKIMTGVNFALVPYSSISQETADLLSGYVQLTLASPASVVPHLKSGKLRALAVTSARSSALFPDLPTIAASGVPGYEAVSIYGIFAPLNTPATIINRLNQEIVRGLNTADVKEKFLSMGQDVIASSPKELAAAMEFHIATWGKVIKDVGIRVD